MPELAFPLSRPSTLLGAAVLATAAMLGGPASAQDGPAASLDAEERAAMEQVIQEYLLANPEVVIDALNAYQERQDELARLQQTEQVRALADQIFHADGSPVGGNPDGDVTLVEFFDYNCGYCKRVMPTVDAVAEADPNLRIVYKEFPILSEGSMIAARAALASRAQDLYEPFHEALMGFEGRIGESEVFAIAEGVGLDVEQLREDMGSDAVTAEIAANMDLARALQINGTPAFVVGDQVIPGAVPQAALESAIADARGS